MVGVSKWRLPDLGLSVLFILFFFLFVVLGAFPIFWDLPDFGGIFQIGLFLFLARLGPPTRNIPERVRDIIRTFPEKKGNPPVWKPPRLTFFQVVLDKAMQCLVWRLTIASDLRLRAEISGPKTILFLQEF